MEKEKINDIEKEIDAFLDLMHKIYSYLGELQEKGNKLSLLVDSDVYSDRDSADAVKNIIREYYHYLYKFREKSEHIDDALRDYYSNLENIKDVLLDIDSSVVELMMSQPIRWKIDSKD